MTNSFNKERFLAYGRFAKDFAKGFCYGFTAVVLPALIVGIVMTNASNDTNVNA